ACVGRDLRRRLTRLGDGSRSAGPRGVAPAPVPPAPHPARRPRCRVAAPRARPLVVGGVGSSLSPEPGAYLAFLGLYDAVFAILSWAAFEYVVTECASRDPLCQPSRRPRPRS